MGEKRTLYLIIFLIILCINLADAAFQVGVPNYSIEKKYEGGMGIIGWINISFDNELNDSFFNDSFGNSITLQELLDENTNFLYSITDDGKVSNSSSQMLYLTDGDFLTPEISKNYTYYLNLSNIKLFSEKIEIVIIPSDVNITLQAKIKNLNSIKATIANFDSFVQKILNKTLKINETEKELEELQEAYENASATDEEILENLSEITIPESIYISKSSNALTFISNKSKINLDVLESIDMGTNETGKESEYINSVINWSQKNIETKVSFIELSAVYNETNEVSIRIFDVNISKKNSLDYAPVFIIKKLAGMEFKEDYGENKSGEYYYILLPNSKKTISFSTTEKIEFNDLPMFTSPPLSKLSLTEETYEPSSEEDEGKISKWLLFLLIIVLLIIVGIVVYIALSTWYKKRYEKYLFKNKNDLYNIATYITTSKAKGLNNEQINENLGKSGWSAEQIRYAMRKYAGKNTGMLELPVKKVLEKKEKVQ